MAYSLGEDVVETMGEEHIHCDCQHNNMTDWRWIASFNFDR